MSADPADGAPALPHGFQDAIGHAWAWYALHSTQRMQMINFYLVAVAFLTAGYATVSAAGEYFIAAPIAVAGVAVSALFNALDARTRELIRVSEPALDQLESHLVATGFPNMDFLSRTKATARRTPSYRRSLNVLTGLGVVAFLAAFTSALVSAM